MTAFGWQAQIEAGDEGVVRFGEWMRERGYTVVDVSLDPTYQRQDIDLIVGGRTVEVKTDSHKPRNFFFELAYASGRPGCVFRSRAELWAYWFPESGDLYLIRVPELQLWLVEHANEYRRRRVVSEGIYSTVRVDGVAVPVKKLAGIAQHFRMEREHASTEEGSQVA